MARRPARVFLRVLLLVHHQRVGGVALGGVLVEVGALHHVEGVKGQPRCCKGLCSGALNDL